MLIQINIQQIKRRNTIKRSNTIYKIDHYHMEQFFFKYFIDIGIFCHGLLNILWEHEISQMFLSDLYDD